MKYKIKDAFEERLPGLTDEEYELLEASILKHGVLDPLKTWNGFIIDGHNRFYIAEKHGIEITVPPTVMDDEFDDEDEVQLWIINTQAGRRNLSDIERIDLFKWKYDYLKRKGKEKKVEGGRKGGQVSVNEKDKDKSSDNISLDQPHSTREALAKELGWSISKTGQGIYIMNNATDEEMGEFFKEKTKIGKAYKAVKERVKAEEAEQESSDSSSPELTEEEIFERELNKILETVDSIIKNADSLHNKIFKVNTTMDDLGIKTMDNGIDAINTVAAFTKLMQAATRMLQRFGIELPNNETTKTIEHV